jgi:excinuclease ABC subunit C
MFPRGVGRATQPARNSPTISRSCKLATVPDQADFDLQSFLKSPAAKPGVYRMLGKEGEILYVGKARHLRNRVSSYFHGRAHGDRTLAVVSQVASVEVTVTASETEACCSSST